MRRFLPLVDIACPGKVFQNIASLINRTLLQQLLCELSVSYDAFLNQELCERVCHGEG